MNTLNVVPMTARRDDEPSPQLLRQMVTDNDDKHEEAHKRLRIDVRDLQERSEQFERTQERLLREVANLDRRKPDASELRVPLPMMLTVIVGFLGIAASIYSMNSTLREAITVQGAQLENLKETIQRLDRQQQLQYAEFQTFRQEMARRH